MSQTLQNQIILARSMNSIVELNDGAGTSISNGQVITTTVNSNSITSNNLTLNGILDLNNSLELEQFDNISTAVGLVSLWEKGNAYFTYLPQSLATPTLSSDFITKLFADNTYASITGTNNFTGTNTFNTNLPTSTLTPTTNFQLCNKLYVDTKASKSGINNFTGTNTFDTNLPSSILTPTIFSELCNKQYVDTKASSTDVVIYNSSKNCFYGGTNALTTQIAGAGTNLKNIAIGNFSMTSASNSAIENIFIGDSAGQSLTSGFGNLCFGVQAGNILTTGFENVAIGNTSMQYATTASQNVCLGNRSGQQLTTGLENFCLGLQALGSCTTGSFNVGIGVNALLGQNTGNESIGIGRYALAGCDGTNNTGIGYFCGVQMLNCSRNTLIGAYTMWQHIISPFDCTAIGYYAGAEQNGNGISNTYVGANSLTSAVNPSYCTLLGANTNCTGNFSNSTAVGVGSVITGNDQIILGRTTETTFAIGGLTIPNGSKVLSAQGYLASTGPGILPVMNSIKALHVYPPLYTLSTALNDIVLAMGQFTCDNLQFGSNAGVVAYGTSCLTNKTISTFSTTVFGDSNLNQHTTANFFNTIVIGQGNLDDVGSNYPISNTYVIGDNTTALNPTGSVLPTSVNSCTLINSAGIRLPSAAAVSDIYGIATDQYITGSNQGLIGRPTIPVTIFGNTKLDSATGLQYGTKYKPNSVFQTIGGAATNWNTTPPANFSKYVLFSASGAGTVVLTLPLISSDAIYEGFEFIFRRTNTAASASTTSILQVARSGTDTIYGINLMTTAATVNVLASGAYYGKIVCINKTTTPYNWAYFPS